MARPKKLKLHHLRPISITLRKDQYAQLQQIYKETGKSVSASIRKYVDDGLKKETRSDT